MEDLVPLIFFLVIVVVNALKFFIEKGGKSKRTGKENPQQPEEAPRKQATSIEGFFETLTDQFTAQPTKVAAWPEGRERPDYVHEMEEFESEQLEELENDPIVEMIPMPVAESIVPVLRKVEEPARIEHHAPPSTHTVLSGSHGLRIPGMDAYMRSGNAGRNNFRITGGDNLRQAMLAHVVFGPPRAFDLSFDNTIARRGQV